MAEFIDSIGRKIDATNMELGALRQLIGTMMGAKTGKARPFGPPDGKDDRRRGHLEKIRRILEKYSKSFQKEFQDQNKHLKEVIDAIKDLAKLRADKKSSGGGPAGGGPADGDEKPRRRRKGKTGTSKTGDGGEPDNIKNSGFYFAERKIFKLERFSREVQEVFLGFDSWNTAIGGVIDKERKFTQDIRRIAFQTAGVTKESMALQKVYEQIGTSAAETGVDRTQFQESYIKSLKAGVKNEKVALGLAKAQLNTENQLGLEAGALHDTFLGWVQSGKMNLNQISQMGRGLREIARNTGMTGEALASAVKTSEEFITQLRNAATLTAASASNVVEMVANAKKLGIEKELQPLIKGMTSVNALLFETSGQTQALLFNAANSVGRLDELMNGTITKSKAGIRDMATGLEATLKQFGVSSIEAVDELSDEAKKQLNISLKASYGIELGQLTRQIEALRESGKTAAMRLKEIDDQMKQNLTTEEKATLVEKKRALSASTNLSVLTAFSEAAKNAKNMDDALARFGKRSGEFTEDLQAMGQAAGNSSEILRGSLNATIENLNAGLKKAGKEQLKVGSKDVENALGDKNSMDALLKQLNSADRMLSTAQDAQLDPMRDMQQKLKKINDNIRIMTQSLFSKMFNSVIGKLVAIGGTLLGILAGIGFLGFRLANVRDAINGLLGIHPKMPHPKAGGPPAGRLSRAGDAIGSGTRRAGEGLQSGLKSAGKGITEGSEKLAEGILKKSEKGFVSLVKSSWTSAFEVTKEGIVGMGKGIKAVATTTFSATKFAVTKSFSGVATAFSEGGKAIWNGAKAIKSGPGIVGIIKNLPNLLTKGFGAGLAGITKAGGRAAGGLLKLAGAMNPFGLAVMAVFAAVDGLTGSMDAAARAHEIFGKKMEDVTLTEEYSAKSAGLLIGVLDGLSFGILGMVFDLKSWTDDLSRFFAKVPIFTAVIAPLVIALEAIWGVIKGVGLAIWEVLKGIWDGIMEIVNPLVEGISNIFSSLGNALGMGGDKASGLTRIFRELGGVVGIISGPIKFVGTAIGWIFRIIGKVVGFVVKVIAKLIEGFVSFLSPIGEVLDALWGGIKEVGEAIGDVFSEIWGVISPIISPVIEFFNDIGKWIGNLFGGSGGGGFFDFVKQVGQALAFIPKILMRFIIRPFMLLAKLFSGIAKVIQAVIALFKGETGQAKELLKSAIGGIIDAIVYPFKSILDWFGATGQTIWEFASDAFNWILKLPGKILQFLLDLPGMLWDGLISLGKAIVDAIGSAITSVGTFIYDAFTGALKRVVDFVLGLIPGKNTVAAFSGSEEENKAREAKEGSGVLSGIGRTLGGITSLDLGKTWGGISETGSAVLDTINPLNWFADGTREVQNTGLAMLHKDEMVIPANAVKGLTAQGSGPFGSVGSFLGDMFSGPMKMIDSAFDSVGSLFSSPMKMFSGLFDSNTPSERAIDERVSGTQANALSDLTKTMGELINEAMYGDGILVQDAMLSKAILGTSNADGEARGIGMLTNPIMAKVIEKQANEANGSQPLGYKLADSASAEQMAKMGLPGIIPDIISGPLSIGDNLVNGLMSLLGVDTAAPTNSPQRGIISSIMRTSPIANDPQSVVANNKASTEPIKTEVVSMDLGNIADETAHQSTQLEQLVSLFTQVLEVLKPKSIPSSSTGGFPGDTSAKEVVHKPANYFRNTTGLVAQTAGKAILNLGPPKA